MVPGKAQLPRDEREARDQEIVRRYLAGDKVTDIVETVGNRGSSSVYRALKRAGVIFRVANPEEHDYPQMRRIVADLDDAIIAQDWEKVKHVYALLRRLVLKV